VTSVGFDPTGRTVVTGSSDGTARLWDALPQGTLTPILRGRQPVDTLWASANPVTFAGRQLHILTTAGRVLTTGTMRAPIVSAAAQGNQVAALDADGNLATSTTNGLITRRESGFRGTAIAFSSQGKLLVGTATGSVCSGPHETPCVNA